MIEGARRSNILLALVGLLALAMTGCALPFGGGSDLRVRSDAPSGGAQLRGDFDKAIYSVDSQGNATLVLIDGPPEQPTQAVTIRLLWLPRLGATPVEATATNATIQYVVFAPPAGGGAGEVGVYSGAGYLYPNNSLGSKKLSAGIWNSTLRLSDRSERFNDLLGKATLTGGVHARLDEAAVDDAIHRLNMMITERLGYPRMVDGDPRPVAPLATR